MRIRLGDEDRERLGCPEWMEFDPSRLTLVEAETMDEHGLVMDTFGRWYELLLGDPVKGPDGKDLMVTGSDGKKVARRRVRPIVWRALVWAALRRAGVEVEFAGFDFDMTAVRTGEVEGKGLEPEAASGRPSPTRRRATSRSSPRSATSARATSTS